MKTLAILFSLWATQVVTLTATAQEGSFGKNKVQYTDFEWYYIQSAHFDVYFSKGSESLANFTADVAESSYNSISASFRYQITNRIPIVVYNSHNQFQQTNVVNSYLEEGIGGVTELFKNRVVIPFEGEYKKFRHVIHHELVHAVINDMFYGGSVQSIITNNITLQLPLWFNEGLAEFEALRWDTDSDMFLRDATVHEYLPPIQYLSGYFAYRGGQSVWNYIATKYGDQKISEILSRVKSSRSVDQGFRGALGLSVEELSERWQKEQKVLYWPDIAKREEPADYAKQLTDHTKDGSFYNTSPALSPQGDRLAFISNRDDYFDVFIMNTLDGSIVDKVVKGQRTPDFEELHLLTPGMAWSANGKRLAVTAKSGKEDAIILIDVESGDEEKIEFGLDGIFSVDWSSTGILAFIGVKAGRSDVYTYSLETKALTDLTGDFFSDAAPSWSSDGSTIFFSSDRRDNIERERPTHEFKMQNYDFRQFDLYAIDVATKRITRLTDLPESEETSPVATHDGNHLLFISDQNGINNIYVKSLDSGTVYPLTNSLSGVYQLTLSADGNKLAFASLQKGGFDLFIMRGPMDRAKRRTHLEQTEYFRRLNEWSHRTQTATAAAESLAISDDVVINIDDRDSSAAYHVDTRLDLSNYVFYDAFAGHRDSPTDTARLATITDNVDANGNYKVNKYKLNFSPDIIYGNAGYNTFYGVQGSTIMEFSDMLGDHQIYLLTNLLFDLKNSDYALAYLYLPKRIDYGIQLFHSARFLLLEDSIYGENLFRFRNYGAAGLSSYPINRYNRFEFNVSWFNITRENLDVVSAPSQNRTLVVPSISYVHDNSLWGLLAPDNGTRYNLSLMASPKFGDGGLGFYTVTLDYRSYTKLWRNYTFALRFAGGGSFGQDPQRFIIGGVDNWINRQFENNRVPIENAEDFVFLTTGIPLRGYNYSAQVGSKYGLVNMEFRFPLLGYLSAGPLPIFLQSLSGVFFLDIGGAWTHQNDFKGVARDSLGSIYLNDLLAGTGYGVRTVLLGFLLKLDVAWSFNLQATSQPKYYFSVGADL